MPREHANLRLDIWADDDWRSLTRDAQWLYELLLTHPKTNRAGVCEWHPGKLSRMAAATTSAQIIFIAVELVDSHFIVIDETTDEVVIRSYIKHDGVLKQPNMTKTMANDFAGLASPLIRSVIAFELQKLSEQEPGFAAWKEKGVRTILGANAVDAKTLTHAVTHRFTHPVGVTDAIGLPIGLGSHTSTSTSTEASLPDEDGEARMKETRLPADWAPTQSHFSLAKERGLNIAAQADAFRLHAETHDRHAARWNAAFTTWLKKSPVTVATVGNPDAWMNIR